MYFLTYKRIPAFVDWFTVGKFYLIRKKPYETSCYIKDDVGDVITAIIGQGAGHDAVIFSYASILKSNGTPPQSGEFLCACDAGGGVLYAGSQGHVWKSVDYGDTWSDLGDQAEGDWITSIAVNNGRIIFTTNER
jgi:hypothetical protein